MFTANDDSDGNVAAIARREWFLRWGRRLIVVLALAATTAAGIRGYARWFERHLANRARAFCDQHDYLNATRVARRVLLLDTANVKACRVLAEAAEIKGSAESVFWRLKVALLRPQNTDDQFALAEDALRFEQSDLAGKVLASIPIVARDCHAG